MRASCCGEVPTHLLASVVVWAMAAPVVTQPEFGCHIAHQIDVTLAVIALNECTRSLALVLHTRLILPICVHLSSHGQWRGQSDRWYLGCITHLPSHRYRYRLREFMHRIIYSLYRINSSEYFFILIHTRTNY